MNNDNGLYGASTDQWGSPTPPPPPPWEYQPAPPPLSNPQKLQGTRADDNGNKKGSSDADIKMQNFCGFLCIGGLIASIFFAIYGTVRATAYFQAIGECRDKLDQKYLKIDESMYRCEEDGRGNALLFHGPPMNYDSAQHVCNQFNASVVEIDDKEYNQLILNYATKEFGGRMIWLGITDRAEEGVWTGSPDSTPKTYSNWYKGQPDSFGGEEDCAALAPNDNELCFCFDSLCDANGQWVDAGCAEEKHFICNAPSQTCNNFEVITTTTTTSIVTTTFLLTSTTLPNNMLNTTD